MTLNKFISNYGLDNGDSRSLVEHLLRTKPKFYADFKEIYEKTFNKGIGFTKQCNCFGKAYVRLNSLISLYNANKSAKSTKK